MRHLLFAFSLLFSPVALAQQQPPAADGAALPSGKLPDQARPIAYRLDLTIVPDRPRFSGHAEIDIDLRHAASSIFLHGRNLAMRSATVAVGGRSYRARFTQRTQHGLAQLDFGRELPAGRMTLRFDYDAAFGTGPSGLYRVNVEDRWYSWSQFESIDARAAFPAFDEPGYKTPFTVSVTTRAGLFATSNAPQAGTPERKGKLVRYRFAPTAPLPTYLVAFAVGPFATVATTVPPTPQRATPLPVRIVGTQPNAASMAFARDETGKIVSLLERYFDQPFPFPKLDQIGSPIMPGAMENAGADIYGDGILFLDEKAPARQQEAFGMVVAHELAHQWFGDLVTPVWWDDIWLNESFANWMGYRIGNEWRPGLEMNASAIREALAAMDIDALSVGRPIHERITRDGDIDAAFDQITYGKGGQVVAMIADFMGDTAFRDGVRLHMSRHRYGNASTDDFFGALADAAHDPRVLAALRSFVDQQGVPLVRLRRQGGTLVATQQPYAYFGTNVAARQWIIPFCVRQAAAKACTLIDKPEMAIRAPAGTGAMIPNAEGTGYYRFDLDPADWQALMAGFATLPQGEALAVTDSLWASFYAGQPRLDALFALARASAAHPAQRVLLDNAHRLEGLRARGLVSAAADPAFRRQVGAIYGPLLAKLGFDPAAGAYAGEDHERRELRSELVGLLVRAGNDAALRGKLVAALDAALAGKADALDDAFGSLAVAAAIQERGAAFGQSLIDRAHRTPALAAAIYEGIAQSGNADLARTLVTQPGKAGLDDNAWLGLAEGFAADPATRDLVAPTLIANFSKVLASPGGIFSGHGPEMFRGMCTEAAADALTGELRPMLAKRGSTLSVDRTIETIRNCARFRAAKADTVSDAIARLD